MTRTFEIKYIFAIKKFRQILNHYHSLYRIFIA